MPAIENRNTVMHCLKSPRAASAHSRRGWILCWSILWLLPPFLAAQEVPERASPKEVRPGEKALVKASKGMSYFLRVPRSYVPKRGARLIVFLHGSNMNGLTYLRSFETKRWAEDAILACPNGEKGTDPHGQNNFTFESAPYVADVTEQVQKELRVTRTFIGGHSQGGFLTYSVFLQHPDLYQGAFPMAGDCWMQNEPNLWETEPDILEKQKRIALAVIHGKKDPVVAFSQGQHAYDIFVAMGYPKLRLLAPENLGHEFMLSPVDEALEWLDAMNAADPQQSLRLASDWARKKEWGWVMESARALLAAERVPRAVRNASEKLQKLVERHASKAAPKIESLMKESRPEEWLPSWYEFRRVFGGTQAASELVEHYESERAEQRATGQRLFREARSHFQGGNKEAGRKSLRELLEKAPATYEAYYALEWLEED